MTMKLSNSRDNDKKIITFLDLQYPTAEDELVDHELVLFHQDSLSDIPTKFRRTCGYHQMIALQKI